MDLGELWTGLLEFVAAIIIPVWNDLIQYLPLVILLLVLAAAAGLAWWWQRHAALNRPRVPAPVPIEKSIFHILLRGTLAPAGCG